MVTGTDTIPFSTSKDYRKIDDIPQEQDVSLWQRIQTNGNESTPSTKATGFIDFKEAPQHKTPILKNLTWGDHERQKLKLSIPVSDQALDIVLTEQDGQPQTFLLPSQDELNAEVRRSNPGTSQQTYSGPKKVELEFYKPTHADEPWEVKRRPDHPEKYLGIAPKKSLTGSKAAIHNDIYMSVFLRINGLSIDEAKPKEKAAPEQQRGDKAHADTDNEKPLSADIAISQEQEENLESDISLESDSVTESIEPEESELSGHNDGQESTTSDNDSTMSSQPSNSSDKHQSSNIEDGNPTNIDVEINPVEDAIPRKKESIIAVEIDQTDENSSHMDDDDDATSHSDNNSSDSLYSVPSEISFTTSESDKDSVKSHASKRDNPSQHSDMLDNAGSQTEDFESTRLSLLEEHSLSGERLTIDGRSLASELNLSEVEERSLSDTEAASDNSSTSTSSITIEDPKPTAPRFPTAAGIPAPVANPVAGITWLGQHTKPEDEEEVKKPVAPSITVMLKPRAITNEESIQRQDRPVPTAQGSLETNQEIALKNTPKSRPNYTTTVEIRPREGDPSTSDSAQLASTHPNKRNTVGARGTFENLSPEKKKAIQRELENISDTRFEQMIQAYYSKYESKLLDGFLPIGKSDKERRQFFSTRMRAPGGPLEMIKNVINAPGDHLANLQIDEVRLKPKGFHEWADVIEQRLSNMISKDITRKLFD
jgi:hypothetical protein